MNKDGIVKRFSQLKFHVDYEGDVGTIKLPPFASEDAIKLMEKIKQLFIEMNILSPEVVINFPPSIWEEEISAGVFKK